MFSPLFISVIFGICNGLDEYSFQDLDEPPVIEDGEDFDRNIEDGTMASNLEGDKYRVHRLLSNIYSIAFHLVKASKSF